MASVGYQPGFLGDGNVVELPTITAEQIANVLVSEHLRDGHLVDYLNYTVVMNKTTRQAFYSAANADFGANTGSGRRFRVDSRVGEEHQLGNIFYKDLDGVENPYDRGHLTRRDAVSWGDTPLEANKASRDSCFFPNVSLQHKHFNQDEWHALEKAIETSNTDADNRFNIFVGPVFTRIDRCVMPLPTLPPGRVPSAFWKIVAYIGKNTGSVESNAFVVFQDDEALRGLRQVLGNEELDPFALYQTSTTLVEEMTGIEFPEQLADNNPMLFTPGPAADALGVSTPQIQRVQPLETDHGITFAQ